MLLSMCPIFEYIFELVHQIGLNNSLMSQQFKWLLKEKTYFSEQSDL